MGAVSMQSQKHGSNGQKVGMRNGNGRRIKHVALKGARSCEARNSHEEAAEEHHEEEAFVHGVEVSVSCRSTRARGLN